MKLGQKIAIAYIRARLAWLSVFSKKKAAQRAYELFCTPLKRVRRPLSPLFQQAEPCSVTVNGITVKGFRWNKGGHTRVQLVHGFESASQNFEVYIRAFIDKGYEVLAFDAPAHGVSGGLQITLTLYIDALRAIYQAYGPVQSFLAHSFGGLALVHFLETLPAGTSFRLALVAPATEAVTAIDGFFTLLQLDADVRAAFNAIIRRKDNVDPAHFSITRAMAHIHNPVLWVHDKTDTVTPLSDVQPVIDKQYPHLRFLITDGFGHRRIYREQSVVETITGFL